MRLLFLLSALPFRESGRVWLGSVLNTMDVCSQNLKMLLSFFFLACITVSEYLLQGHLLNDLHLDFSGLALLLTHRCVYLGKTPRIYV